MPRFLVLFVVVVLTVSSAFAADSAQKLYLSASQAERAGDTPKAMALYEEIVNRFPDSPLAIKAADKLTENKKASDAKAEAQRQEKKKASDAFWESQRREEDQRNARLQQEIQQCETEYGQCKQVCAMKYATYDERYSSCTMGCGSQRCLMIMPRRPSY